MEEPERPSKSQRKRDMEALQKIGARLVDLNAGQLAQIELPERLLVAVLEAQRIRDFEGRRRQLQYIGKLMREVDPAPILDRLEQWRGVARRHTTSQHLTERWRERLLAEDDAFAMFAAAYPGSDLQPLRALVAGVKHDQAVGRPPKHYRDLFRAVRDIIVKSSATENTE